MSLTRTMYDVELSDGTVHRVEILAADQLRAELEAGRHGIPVDVAQAPVQTAVLWAWAALVRTKVTDAKFKPFQHEELVDLQRVPPAQANQPDHPELGPTELGQD